MVEQFKLEGPPKEAVADEKNAPPNPDPFSDIRNLVVPQAYLGAVKVKTVLSTVGTDKPNKQVFFRVRDGEDYTAQVGILKVQEEGEIGKKNYLVLPQMYDALLDDITYAQIYLCQTKQGAYHLWAVSLPKDGADMSEWSSTALEHIEIAKTVWIRIGKNKAGNGYARTESETPFPDPTWENLPLIEFLRIGFKGERIISKSDHPVVLKLRGKV